jgi:hypothetical protein
MFCGTAQVSHYVCQFFCQLCVTCARDIVVSVGKLRKLWDSMSELRSCVCERRLERTVLRPALLPVKTVKCTQFIRQVWRHSKIAQFNWVYIGRFTIQFWSVNVRAQYPQRVSLSTSQAAFVLSACNKRFLRILHKHFCSRTIITMAGIVRYRGDEPNSWKCPVLVLTACMPKADPETLTLHCKGLHVCDLRSSGIWLPMFRRSHLQVSGSRRMSAWPLKMVPEGCPETSVTNKQSTQHNVPE